MKDLAESLQISSRIQWFGQIGIADVAELMRQCDFLVLPSRSEGRPNVVVEAMASGLPVIATAVGSVPELVCDASTSAADPTGILVPVDDIDALRTALSELLQDEALRHRIGRNAHAFVESANLTWDRTAEEFEQIFDEAIHATDK